MHGRIALATLLGACLASLPSSSVEMPSGVTDCLDCHADDTLTLTFEDGTELSLFVDGEEFMASVHGVDLVCADCHEGYDDDHPFDGGFTDRRSYVKASYELCRPCHFDTYTRTLESVHFELYQAEGNLDIPVCSECHGAHDVHDPSNRHEMMSRSCGSCHTEVYRVYEASVHGAALSQASDDVPACADCHTAHQIAHAADLEFHVASAGLCLGCHGDREMMVRYGLSTTIGETYLTDFHGVTASLADPENVRPEDVVVVCVDCHGAHEIASPDAIGEEAMRARVGAVCQECHEGASESYPAAWLSHYPPSLTHAPLVFLVKLFYWIFIPFMVVGLGLQVGLHLYRVGVRR